MTNHAKVAFYFPDAYKGKVTYHQEEMTIIEIATLLKFPPIFQRYGDWAVTAEGVQCLTTQYDVDLGRIDEQDWVRHMEEKMWVSIEDFRNALHAARDMVKLGILKVEAQANA